MRPLGIILYIILICNVYSQTTSIENLNKKFMNFDYSEVITQAEQMLSDSVFNPTELIQIYEMKGIAHFSLGQEEEARSAFMQLLNEEPNYSMDPNKISPKIISFFNEIKVGYQTQLEEEKPIRDSLKIVRDNFLIQQSDYKAALVKNLLLPGWGQFQLGNSSKGIIYSLLSIASSASSVFFIIETNKTEKAYLNETNKNLIEGKYNDYNSAYKTRNLLVATTAIVWIISQLDILFFTELNSQPATFTSGNMPAKFSEIQLNFSIPFN